jgi:hypothetical protein
MVVDLENLDGLHKEFRNRFIKYDSIFTNCEHVEHYYDNCEILRLIIDINNYCLKNQIIGYHYTNAIENDILKNGIIIRDGKDIRNDFINRYFHLFTENEKKQILQKWKEYFIDNKIKFRDSRVFFNFTKNALINGGADLLLNYYGGEQIYFPLYKEPYIGGKLKQIGTPMILKCILNPNDIKTFIEYPWGKIAISSYNRIKNPNAYVVDQDGYQKVGVKPENIVIIKH